MKIKYNRILMLIAACGAMVGCSDDAIQKDYASMEEALAPSDYEITLGAVSADMKDASILKPKAAIRVEDSGAFDSEVELFMLATHPTFTAFDNSTRYWGATYTLDCRWNQGDYSHATFMKNYKAKVTYKDETDPTKGSVVKINTRDRMCYPIGSMHAYTFYSYAPRTDSVVTYPDTIKVVWAKGGKKAAHLDGTQDIIYASALPGDDNNPIRNSYQNIAWSANYFRYQENRDQATDEAKSELNPRLAFSHKLMQLMFSIQPGGVDENGVPVDEASKGGLQLNYDDAAKTQVVSVAITNVPDTVWLTIAQRENTEHNGELTYSSDKRTSTYYLKQWIKKGNLYSSDKELTPVTPKVKKYTITVPEQVTTRYPVLDEEGNPTYDRYGDQIFEERIETIYHDELVTEPIVTKLGGPDDTHLQGIMLPALTEADRKSLEGSYKLQVVVKYPADAKNEEDIKYYVSTFDLDSDPEKSNKYYRQGYSYDVKLRIYGPNVIKPETSVRSGWQEVDSDDLWQYTGGKKPETTKPGTGK